MSNWRSKVAAACLYVAWVALLTPGCDQLGLGGGGAGGGDPLGGSLCQNACYTEYDAAVNACAKIASDTDRKACQDQANAALTQCMAACDNAPTNKKECDEKYQKCDASAPTSCLKKEGGKSQCQRCLERCNAGDPPSSTCKKCLF